MSDVNFNHETVLLQEAVDALISDAAGVYVDATFGRGGHSEAILARLGRSGQLLGIDKDPVAVNAGNVLSTADTRFSMFHGSFSDVTSVSSDHFGGCIDGVLADLGVSSPQLDDAERGFSFMNDGPLDMRMNPQEGLSAAEWLKVAPVSEIATVLKNYGEERFAKRIASAIVDERGKVPLVSTLQLAKVVSDSNPAWEKHKHPATRAFQAIRIKINNELGDLELFLSGAAKSLKVGGRLVVISFHSLEDRAVKRFMRDMAKGDAPPPGVPVFEKDIIRNFKVLSKAIKPTKDEVERNPRSRSAVMRILEKISDD